MRLKKLPELIHKSDLYPDLDYAKVEVHFQEINDYLDDDHTFDVVPASQFVLSRTAHKNGDSFYYLNDRKINWTEATKLLMAKVQINILGFIIIFAIVFACSYLFCVHFAMCVYFQGIDLDHNRFLILQGEVEQISLMKPKAPSPNEEGLLEYAQHLIIFSFLF